MTKKFKIFLGLTLIAGSIPLYQYFNSSKTFMYAGTLDITKVIISSKVATDIISLPPEEGMSIKKGDLISKLNEESFKIASKQIDADFQRCIKLSKAKALPQAEFDKATRAKEENDLHIKDCEIRSPIDGIVIAKFKEEGEYITPGAPIISIANPYNIWAYFYVPYDMIHKLKIGDKVKGVLQEAPGKEYYGVISKINEEAEFTPKNVQTREERTRLVFGVKVRFENKDLELKAGMTMETSLAN
ncbi:MAG: efflux RND transporter periplasmic adaptor subunit [Holosporales bacterium]|nr:efflux RND transporter periplasmic adaptor subunit [Holosporales bacterium]